MVQNLDTASRATRDSREEDRAVGLVLRIGAYASIVLLLVAGVMMLAGARGAATHVAEAGVLALMSTPITHGYWWRRSFSGVRGTGGMRWFRWECL